MSSFNDEHTLRDEASQNIENSYQEASQQAKDTAKKGYDLGKKVLKKDNPIKKQLGLDKVQQKGAQVAKKGATKVAKAAGQAAKKAAQAAGKFALKVGAKLAGAGLAALAPYAVFIVAGLAIIGVVAFSASIIIDEEYSRTNAANYQHVKVGDGNRLKRNFTAGAGNVYFNSETKRYELAKGEAPTEANKLYYVYYAIMANQSRWFVEYERTDTKPGDPGAGTRENPYFKPIKRKDEYLKYTLDGYMFNHNVIDKVGLRPVDSSKKVKLEDLVDETAADSVKKLSMNVNLLYLLNSTLNGSMYGTGKTQMFFTEQFVKPVNHDDQYNFEALSKYRDMTEDEKKKYASRAHGDSEDSKLEKDFQEKYALWGQTLDAQNDARGGSNSGSSKSSGGGGGGGDTASAEGIDNPYLKKAVEWGLAQIGKGITYSMEGSRTTADGTADCSGFVMTALKEGAGLDYGSWAWTTVGMLQNSNAMGQSGTFFKEVDYRTAKKGTIIVVGGLGGAGGAGHTFFLLEDFHGDDTKVLECSFGYNGISKEGTFLYASMNYNNVVALEPTGESAGSGSTSSSSSSSGSKKKASSSGDKKGKTDFSQAIDNKYKDKITTTVLEAKSRKFDVGYDPKITKELASYEPINYARFKTGDYLIHEEDYAKAATDFAPEKLGEALAAPKTANGRPILDGEGIADHYEPAINPLGQYEPEKDELMKWALKKGYNPALLVAIIGITTNNGQDSMDGGKYNFLNDPEVLEMEREGESDASSTEGEETATSSSSEEASTSSSSEETSAETEESAEGGDDASRRARQNLRLNNTDNYGNRYYSLKRKVEDLQGGLDYLTTKILEENEGGEFTWTQAEKMGLTKRKYDDIVKAYRTLGGSGSPHLKMAEEGIRVYTYNGSGNEDKEALKVITIDGKNDDTEINGVKKYQTRQEYVRFGTGVSDTNGSYAIKRGADGEPEKTTGVWDYGFGSIIKMAKMTYYAYEIGIDKHGNYYLQADDTGNWFTQLFNGPDITSDTQYQILGATTAFGSLDLSNEIAESQYKIEQVIEKLKRGEVLNGDDVSTLLKHKENGTSIKAGDRIITASPGNFIVSTKPILEKEPALSDANGGQYLLDYVQNYETYVPSVVKKDLDVVERYRKMNDVNQYQQDALNRIQDIFNDTLAGGGSKSGGGSGGEPGGAYDASRFTGKTYKGTGSYKGDIPVASGANEEQNKFLNKISEGAMDSWVKYGILPSVVMAQAIIESDWGRSGLSQQNNNLFGVKGTGDKGSAMWNTREQNADGSEYYVDAPFANYSSWNASIEAHGKLLSGNTGMPNYLKAVKEKDSKAAITAIREGGYATATDYIDVVYGTVVTEGLTEYDKYAIEYTDKNGFEATASGQVNPGGADNTTSVSGGSASGTGAESVWGDGSGFWDGVVDFFTDIQETFLSVFNGDESFDPTMFSTEQIKNERELTDLKTGKVYAPDSLIVNGSDAYRWSYHSNKLSSDNADMLLRQFVASIETRDNRPVYYDEVFENFNNYDLSRILEENFKDAIVGLFKQPPKESGRTSSSIRPEITADLFKGQSLKDTVATQAYGWYKDASGNVKFSPGLTLKGTPGAEVNALKNGKVVFVGDTEHGKTVIIRSNNGSDYIAYVGLGQIDVKVDDAVSQATPIGKAGSDGLMRIWGIRAGTDLSKGLPPVPTTDEELDKTIYFDIAPQFGIKGDAQKKLAEDVNGWDTASNAKKPSASQIKSGKGTKLGDHIQTSADFIMPLRLEANQQATVTSPFGVARSLVLQDGRTLNDIHNGVDLVTGSLSTMIIAAADGVVVFAGSPDGNGVVIKHNDGLYTTYWHMADLRVTEGQQIKQGDDIGLIGSTGQSTHPHLHFGVSTGMWDGYVDPMNYIK